MPGVPGLFMEEQKAGWQRVANAIHAKGGVAYLQIWHSGRANIPQMTGTPIVSPSGLPWDDSQECFAYPPPHTEKQVRYREYPPVALSVDHIKRTIQDFVRTAQWAMECGFDGVELHAGNGYLPEQFLASNVNKRTDSYGGSPEKRCTFVLELMEELGKAIGDENLAIRLSPFGLFNQIRSEQRMETWTTLCQKLKQNHPKLSYVSFIEPVSILTRTLSRALLKKDSATSKSTVRLRSRSFSTHGVLGLSICRRSVESLEILHFSLQVASMIRTRGVSSSRAGTTLSCMVDTSSATPTCR
jgi:2,4-dienoyl-CoA reductase-like NADH-dependent reductase (Old Yellow Enzyme family)